MRTIVTDREALGAVRPADLLTYLSTKGWRQAAEFGDGAYWTKIIEDEEAEVLVPLDPTLRDFATRISQALQTLERLGGSTQDEILEDLSIQNADIVRPRFPGAMADGSITLEQGRLLHEKAKEMMIAAACAAVSPKAMFSNKKPELATDYINRARFGLPKRGSYVMTIISPVPLGNAGQIDFLDAVIDGEPFGRKTVRTLVRGIEAITAGCRAAVDRGGDISLITEAVPSGVSANLCEALVGLNEGGGNGGISFDICWSPNRAAPDNVPTLMITPDAIPLIREAARILREAQPLENVEVTGSVQRLQHIRGRQGDVTILAPIEGMPRMIHVYLSGEDHSLAAQAYDTRTLVKCHGSLIREGRSWRLQNPSEFGILAELF